MKRKTSKANLVGKQGKKPVSKDGALVGWPAIAAYLGQPVAVAQRWAREGMPLERRGRSMTARPEELSMWLGKESGTKADIHITPANENDLLAELRRGLKEARGASTRKKR